jgi:hypothetical protein
VLYWSIYHVCSLSFMDYFQIKDRYQRNTYILMFIQINWSIVLFCFCKGKNIFHKRWFTFGFFSKRSFLLWHIKRLHYILYDIEFIYSKNYLSQRETPGKYDLFFLTLHCDIKSILLERWRKKEKNLKFQHKIYFYLLFCN